MTTTADSATIDRWVEELRDFRTRREARQNLIKVGATDAMIACLSDRNDSVVWAAVQSLPQLPDNERALPHLVNLLQQGKLMLDVVTALKEITGKDCGLNVRAWSAELGFAQSEIEAAVGGQTLADVVQQVSEILSVEPTGDDPNYVFEFTLPNSRRQRVFLTGGQVDNEGDELVLIYSPCAPARAKYYEQALRLNAKLPAGAVGIHDLEGSPYFVLIDMLLGAALDPRQLSKTIREIASRADQLEERLTQDDRH